MTTPAEPQADPGGAQAAIDRYRDIAKYLITIFAGVGALLIAGTQLSSLGKLSWEDTPDRVAGAGLGLLLALGSVAWVVREALKILRPIELSLDDVVADADLRAHMDARPGTLGGAPSVTALRDLRAGPLLDDRSEEWNAVAAAVVGQAAHRRAQDQFDGAWRSMLVAALIGSLAIACFAWAVNPPKSATAPATVQPAPAAVSIDLTDDGREALDEAIGEECADEPVQALSVGGAEGAPRVVTLPTTACKAAQFVLSPEWGSAVSSKPAPGK